MKTGIVTERHIAPYPAYRDGHGLQRGHVPRGLEEDHGVYPGHIMPGCVIRPRREP